MRAQKNERRVAKRKHIEGLHIKNLTALTHFQSIAKKARLIDASSTGMLLLVDRRDLIPEELRSNLTLDPLKGELIMFQIDEMDLEIDGRIARTRMIGKGVFEVAVDFTQEAPDYWRECLYDLLPGDDR